jgi:hypothetical protein
MRSSAIALLVIACIGCGEGALSLEENQPESCRRLSEACPGANIFG